MIEWEQDPRTTDGRRGYRDKAGRFRIVPHGVRRFVLLDLAARTSDEAQVGRPGTLAAAHAAAGELVATEGEAEAQLSAKATVPAGGGRTPAATPAGTRALLTMGKGVRVYVSA